MYRRLLTVVVLSLAVSACVPYYSGYSGYRTTEVYTSPAPYYYGGYHSYTVYPRGYYAPSPRYWGPGYRPSPGYHYGGGGGYGGGYGAGVVVN